MHQGFIGIQALHHEKSALEAHKVTKLHYHDLTSSNNEFSSYAQAIMLIVTTSTTYPVDNETLDLYTEGMTLSEFIHEGRPTTTKPTFVALPSLTIHSIFYKCSRGRLCQPQDPSQAFDKTGCDYFLFPTPGKKDHITIDPEIISPYVYSEPSDEPIRHLYGVPSKDNYISDH